MQFKIKSASINISFSFFVFFLFCVLSDKTDFYLQSLFVSLIHETVHIVCIIYFGESKVCKDIDNAITLVNRSFDDYEEQIAEEYKLVLSNDEVFNLSQEFKDAFQEHTEVCISFQEFIKAASIHKICVPAFLAHGNNAGAHTPDKFLQKMNSKLHQKQLFSLPTKYIFISLPIINKSEMMDVIMQKVVKKNNDYRDAYSRL